MLSILQPSISEQDDVSLNENILFVHELLKNQLHQKRRLTLFLCSSGMRWLLLAKKPLAVFMLTYFILALQYNTIALFQSY